MPLRISSRQNGRIKDVVKLNQRRHRDANCVTLVEGVREVARALQGGIVPQEAFVCPELVPPEAAAIVSQLQAMAATTTAHLYEVTADVFAKIAYRQTSGGLLLVIPYQNRSLADLPQRHPAFFMVIAGVEKPGNLGAILRTADGAGCDGVIVSTDGAGTDLHNPNVIRASLGTLFSVPVAAAETIPIITWLKQQGILMVATTPAAKQPYTAVDMTRPVAIIAGGEAHGLSPHWLNEADEQVRIPMLGVADSLNLASSAAILLYEAARQRLH